jgi:hypothetical protein
LREAATVESFAVEHTAAIAQISLQNQELLEAAQKKVKQIELKAYIKRGFDVPSINKFSGRNKGFAVCVYGIRRIVTNYSRLALLYSTQPTLEAKPQLQLIYDQVIYRGT